MAIGPWTIYARQLFPLSYGHPLWGPEPSLTFGEVQLGDVGYLKDGHFCLLFNATQGPEHPVNSLRGVPDGFQPLCLPEHVIKCHPNEITQHLLHSKSLQATSIAASASLNECGAPSSASLSYHCTAEEGALLMLKRPAHRTYIDCDLRIRRYIRENMSSWCAFANDQLEIGLEDKDILFVSGHMKTPLWAEAAFSRSSARGELVIAAGVPSASGEFRVSLSRAVDASAFSRTGPLDRASMWSTEDSEPSEAYDQCIFLNYYKMKRRSWWRSTVIRAAAGGHVFPYDDDDDRASGPGSCPSSDSEYDIQDDVESTYDPVNSLLNYILKHSEADIACASDAELSSLFKVIHFRAYHLHAFGSLSVCSSIQGEVLPKDLESALETLSPLIALDEDGVGTVHPFENGSSDWPIHASHSNSGAVSTLAVTGSQRHYHQRTQPLQEKSNIHKCTVCYKLFTRPSNLAIHMNSHSSAKPFRCPIPTCQRAFAVGSNMKRHLRTHNISTQAFDRTSVASPSQFTVGSGTPLASGSGVHGAGNLPSKPRWVPPSTSWSTPTNVDLLRSPRAGEPTSESDYQDERFQPSSPPLLLPSSPTWNPEDQYSSVRGAEFV